MNAKYPTSMFWRVGGHSIVYRIGIVLAERRVASDFYLASACARRPEVAAICGLQSSLGGGHSVAPATAAYAIPLAHCRKTKTRLLIWLHSTKSTSS